MAAILSLGGKGSHPVYPDLSKVPRKLHTDFYTYTPPGKQYMEFPNL